MPTAYFASGSNRVPEIRGLGKAGADVGVTVPRLSPAAEEEILRLAGSEVAIFVDSGAFSEVRFDADAGGFVIDPARHITHRQWKQILALYKRLGGVLRDQLWVVAPDRVGSQDETLLRLRRYAREIRELQDLGVQILVAMQKGDRSQAEFAALVDEALGFTDWLPALPCKKAATAPDEVRRFLDARRPPHVHLLGLGIRNRQAPQYMEAFAREGCTASVSMDSCWIAANVGRQGRRPRRFTRARDRATAVLGDSANPFTVTELGIYCCFAGNARSSRVES